MKKFFVFALIFGTTIFAQINTGISIKPVLLMPGEISPYSFSFNVNYNFDSTNCIIVCPGFSSDSKASSYFGWDIAFLYKRFLLSNIYGVTGIKLHYNNAPAHGVSVTRFKKTIPMFQIEAGIKLNSTFSFESGILIPISNRILTSRSVGYDYNLKKNIVEEHILKAIFELGFVITF